MSVLLAMGCASGLAADQDAGAISGCGASCDGAAGGQGAKIFCGNGILDEGEACDPGISPDQPGACPARVTIGTPARPIR